MKVFDEFKDFLKEYKILGLVVAFVMAGAVNNLVQSLVNNIIMPLVTPFIPGGTWEQATLALGPFVLKWGSFLSALLNFIILAFVVFLIVKSAEKVKK